MAVSLGATQEFTGPTPLHNVCALNFTNPGARIRELYEQNPGWLRSVWQSKQPLHVAAFHNNVEACKVLLDIKADVDAIDTQGNTPLEAKDKVSST